MILLGLITVQNIYCKRRIKCLKNLTNLAWNLLSKICTELIDHLKNIAYSQQFIDRHKKLKKDFTRERKLTFQSLPYEIFMDLYHKRWPVEVDYLFMKKRIEIGNFSGTTVLSVYQDFHSKVLAKNFAWVLSSPAQETVEKEDNEKKYKYQLNMTQAISKSKDTLFLLFERPRQIVVQLIKDLHAVFMAATEPIRPGRKFKRKHKVNKREHYISYKPCR